MTTGCDTLYELLQIASENSGKSALVTKMEHIIFWVVIFLIALCALIIINYCLRPIRNRNDNQKNHHSHKHHKDKVSIDGRHPKKKWWYTGIFGSGETKHGKRRSGLFVCVLCVLYVCVMFGFVFACMFVCDLFCAFFLVFSATCDLYSNCTN